MLSNRLSDLKRAGAYGRSGSKSGGLKTMVGSQARLVAAAAASVAVFAFSSPAWSETNGIPATATVTQGVAVSPAAHTRTVRHVRHTRSARTTRHIRLAMAEQPVVTPHYLLIGIGF
jgi:hypothetical protein